MSKILQKIKSPEVQTILNDAKFKVATGATTALIALQTVAHAADEAPDMSTVTSSMTSTFATVSSLCLNAIAAIAPVGITIFGGFFVWKKGIAFFKNVTKA